MKKYLLVLSILFVLFGCTAAKSSTIRYEESRIVEKEQKEPEKPKKIYAKKEKVKKHESIVYKGENDKAEISYNLSNNILT